MLFLERAHAAAGMGHFVLDPESQTIEFSSWVRENLGLHDLPIPIERLPEIIAPDDLLHVTEAVAKAMSSQAEFEFEARVVTVHGTTRVQKVSGIAAFDNPETRSGLVGYFGIVRDVTEEKASQESLSIANEEAKRELAARTNILAVVSHEIRTPLGGILGIIDHLRNEHSLAERERALRLIEDSCDALLDTLDGLLQQTRIGHDLKNLEAKPFAPRAVAQRVAELFRPLARRKGIRIEVECLSENQAIGDPARLQQIIANLVSNAVKFTQSGEVRILVSRPNSDSNHWTFAVADTGSGMDQKRAASVFEAFGPSNTDTLGRNNGAGLGLSITKELVDLMQGTISVESELGKGSTFTCCLPLVPFQSADESGGGSVRGAAFVHVERASHRIQIEAAANRIGLSTFDLDDFESTILPKEQPAVLIVDTHLSHEIARKHISAKGPQIILIDGAETCEIERGLEKLATRVGHDDLASGLANMFESKPVAVA
ncbi:MAG: ATP-binding protein [Marinomonas sp.]